MADKRMFSLSVIDSDDFTSMPATTQLLYFHLAMRADDDGFVNKPRQIMMFVGAKEDDMKVLLSKKYVIAFETGVIVIRHWRMHNYIQKDRYKPTAYQTELSQLSNDGNVYSLDTDCIQSVSKLDTDCIQSVSKMDTQNRLDKISIDKNRGGGEERDALPARPDPLVIFAADNLVGLNADLACELTGYRDSLSDDMIRYAINETLANGSRAYSYTRRILNRMVECGYKTLAEVKAAEERRTRAKATPPMNKMDDRPLNGNPFADIEDD